MMLCLHCSIIAVLCQGRYFSFVLVSLQFMCIAAAEQLSRCCLQLMFVQVLNGLLFCVVLQAALLRNRVLLVWLATNWPLAVLVPVFAASSWLLTVIAYISVIFIGWQ
jgi:hypothetical protein